MTKLPEIITLIALVGLLLFVVGCVTPGTMIASFLIAFGVVQKLFKNHALMASTI